MKNDVSNLSNRVLYSTIFVLMFAILVVGVYAYGTNDPITFGHTASEIDGLSSGGSIPSGMIAMFAQACPSGWSEYTALRGRFPRGEPTGNAGSLGQGGSDNAIVVTHTHTVNPPSTTTTSSGAHTHTAGSFVTTAYAEGASGTGNLETSGGVGTAKNVGVTGTSASAGAHTHNVDIVQFDSGSTGSSGTGANIPSYQELIFCVKN
ncbi:MAG: hypothetical protein HY361_00655 [Candidatus Aenigmarchaeota archaeon]|nr:hypothetical protein [Candidatus Aenigmarchaeota archaeon]